MKKWIAALMCIALLMGLAACSQTAQQGSGNETGSNENPNSPAVFGMLTINMNAVVNVSYDEEGFVVALSSGNEMGSEIAESITDPLGLSCSQVVCDLITAIAEGAYATEQYTILLKQAAGAQVPNDTFLETIRAEVEKIAGDRSVILVTEEQLAEDGYLSLDTAKELLVKQLKVEESAISGDPIMQDGRYWLSVTKEDDVVVTYTLHAELGIIEEQPAEPEFDPSENQPNEGYSDPTMDQVGNDEPSFDPMVDPIETEFFGGDEDPTVAATEESTVASTQAQTDATEATAA